MSVSLMAKAKACMVLKHVFFASLVLSTKVVEDKSCPTAYTDMVKIGYNPDFLNGLNDPDLVLFVLAHEVMHIMLKHGLRRGSRNPERWNIAADFAINLMLQKAGFKLWKHCLCDSKYAGMSAEQIYDQREEEREERIKSGKSIEITIGTGRDGAGTADNGITKQDDDFMGGDVHEPENLDPEQRSIIERAIEQRVAQAASLARMQGKLAADIERIIDGILNPPLPWRELLREFLTQSSRSTENWSHRNRRHRECYLPARWDEDAMGELVMIGDTSGSIGDDIFAQIGAEMNEIVEFVRPERVRMIWADDSECSREEVFEAGDPIELHPKGGGGTDLRKPLKFVEKFNPIVVVLITDCYSPWPTEKPPYPLIVVSTTDAKCPWGQMVHMNV